MAISSVPTSLKEYSAILEKDIKDIKEDKKSRFEKLSQAPLNGYEVDIRAVSEKIQAISDNDIAQDAIELSAKLKEMITAFQDFKNDRKIVEYKTLSFGGWLKRFFTDTLPRWLRLESGYTYIKVDDPVDLERTKTEVDAAIRSLYLKIAPKGKKPAEAPENAMWGVEEGVEEGVESKVHIWVKGGGKEEEEYEYEYDAEVSSEGIKFGDETYSSWDSVAEKVRDVAHCGTLQAISAVEGEVRARLGKFLVTKEPRLLEGEEWYVKQEKPNYILCGPGPRLQTPFSVTADGYSREGEPACKTLRELFPDLDEKECVAEKYRAVRKTTFDAIVDRGIIAKYEEGKLKVGDISINISEHLKGDRSFFVVEDSTKGILVTVEGETIQSKNYSIQEDGSLSPLEMGEKLKAATPPDVMQLRFEVEKKVKLQTAASEFVREGEWKFCHEKPVQAWHEEKLGGPIFPTVEQPEYWIEFPSEGKRRFQITFEGNRFNVKLTDGTLISAKTVQEFKQAIDEAVLKKERKGIIISQFNKYGKDLAVTPDALQATCQALSSEKVQPWCIDRLLKEGPPLCIRYGARLEKELPLSLKKQEGRWYFESGTKLYETIEEVVQANNLPPQDHVKTLEQRKLSRESLIKELIGEGFLQTQIKKLPGVSYLQSIFNKLPGQEYARKKLSKHNFFAQHKVSDEEMRAKAVGGVPVAAVYMDEGRYFLAECQLGKDIKREEILLHTWPEPHFVCGERRGPDLYSILPVDVMNLAGERVSGKRAITDNEFFSMYGESLFTKAHSFEEAKALCELLRADIPEGRFLLMVFRDDSQKLCFYRQPKGGEGSGGLIEIDNEAVELFNAVDREWIGSFASFPEFCQSGGVRAASISEVELSKKGEAARPAAEVLPRVLQIDPKADFVVEGKQFFVEKVSRENIREMFKQNVDKIPAGKRLVGVFKEGDLYYLCSLLGGREEPQFQLLEKRDDGHIELSVRGAQDKEEYRNFQELCAKLSAVTNEEVAKIAQVPAPVPERPPVPVARVIGEVAIPLWGEWLDDESHPISDRIATKEFPGLVRNGGPLPPENEYYAFRVWVKGVAMTRKKVDLDAAIECMKKFPVVDQFWLYELASGSTVVTWDTDRQKRAEKIIADVLKETLKDRDHKQALLNYLNEEHNKQAYGEVLPDLLKGIRESFTEAEQRQLGLAQV